MEGVGQGLSPLQALYPAAAGCVPVLQRERNGVWVCQGLPRPPPHPQGVPQGKGVLALPPGAGQEGGPGEW